MSVATSTKTMTTLWLAAAEQLTYRIVIFFPSTTMLSIYLCMYFTYHRVCKSTIEYLSVLDDDDDDVVVVVVHPRVVLNVIGIRMNDRVPYPLHK